MFFGSPKATEAIVPRLLDRVWTVDNEKGRVLWEMGNQGGVSGDCFVKVAYEEPWVSGMHIDPVTNEQTPIPGVLQQFHPGRVRILVLNSSFCFPEFHPHDKDRLIRFKLKYKFWGCLTPDTEVLTRRGWKTRDELIPEDELLTLDPVTDESRWSAPTAVSTYDYDGEMVRWTGQVDALATPNHRWLSEIMHGRGATERFERKTIHGEFVREARQKSRLVLGGGLSFGFAEEPKWSDELVETVAWYVTEGSDHTNQTGYQSIVLGQKREPYLTSIRRLAAWWKARGASFNEIKPFSNGVRQFYLGKGVVDALHEVAPEKQITPEFLCSLTHRQALLFREVLLDGDGSRTHGERNTVRWGQLDVRRRDGYQMLCAMLGIRTNAQPETCVQEYSSRYLGFSALKESREHYTGEVWCPTVPTGYFMARRNGKTYWTGNTSAEGTRQVFTYTELITDDVIEEYINDQLIEGSPRPNPLGTIPIAYTPNTMVSGSPWGLADIHDVISLNREYNEKATDISDIINYHAAPVTVVTGAKANQLEKGPKKVWSGLPKDAQVYNLELGANLAGPLEYMALLKTAMHEMTGVHETALGQQQAISNTSGVALAIQYLPLMQVYHQKRIQYEHLLKRINELVMLTLAVKEPQELQFSPDEGEAPLRPGQLAVLDPSDPITYQATVHWPPPLPTDVLVKLNEEMMKMQMGLQSKRGALRELGESFPDEKMAEIFEELLEDMEDQGALDLKRAAISRAIMELTGMGTDGVPAAPGEPGGPPDQSAGPSVQSAGGPGVTQVAPPAMSPAMLAVAGIEDADAKAMLNSLVTRAMGTKIPQRRNPQPDDED